MNAMKRCLFYTTGFGVLVGIIALTSISVTGCGGATAGAFQSAPTNIPLIERSYRFVMHGLKGEACRLSILGIGIADKSYAAAVGEIHKQVPTEYKPEYQLVNVVSDSSFTFFLIGWESCTIVSADVVLLGPDLRLAPPAPGEIENVGGPGEKKETQATTPKGDDTAPAAAAPPDAACKNDKDCRDRKVCKTGRCVPSGASVTNPFNGPESPYNN